MMASTGDKLISAKVRRGGVINLTYRISDFPRTYITVRCETERLELTRNYRMDAKGKPRLIKNAARGGVVWLRIHKATVSRKKP